MIKRMGNLWALVGAWAAMLCLTLQAAAVPDSDIEQLLDNTEATWTSVKGLIIIVLGFLFALWVAKLVKRAKG